MSERNDELTRLSYTLGENMEDRFYVYMLQDDNGKPFYIGTNKVFSVALGCGSVILRGFSMSIILL